MRWVPFLLLTACAGGVGTPDEQACDRIDTVDANVTASTAGAGAPALELDTSALVDVDGSVASFVRFETSGDALALFASPSSAPTGIRTETEELGLDAPTDDPECDGIGRFDLALPAGSYLLSLAPSSDDVWLFLVRAVTDG